MYFSSNYALYHSMSQRVMAVLESLSPAVEPYSIDEMFIDLRGDKSLHLSGVFWSSAQGTGKELDRTHHGGWALRLQKRWLKVHSGQQSNGHSFPEWSR